MQMMRDVDMKVVNNCARIVASFGANLWPDRASKLVAPSRVERVRKHVVKIQRLQRDGNARGWVLRRQ
jgi:hypothetical protein